MVTDKGLRQGHELDPRLAGANMLAWFRPMFRLLFRHWPITFGAGVAALVVEHLIARLPWPWLQPWWVIALNGFVQTLALTLVVVSAYRVVAQRESVGTALALNEWSPTLLCAAQIAVVWTALACIAAGALFLAGKALTGLLPQLGSAGAVILVLFFYAVLVIPIVLFLLAPLWATLAVASALSSVHAVRSLENGLGAVLASLRLAFDQKWRVLWPSYALGLLAIALYALFTYASIVSSALPAGIVQFLTIALTAMGVAMTFVVERAYLPDLGLEPTDELPTAAAPGAPGAGVGAPAPNRGAAAVAAPSTAADVAALIEDELRSNRTYRLVELVERGVALDANFFAGHPDSTIALAKKLVQAERSDLALRLLQTYLKENRGHRLHLTAALLVANVLARDPRRLADAARFLSQVKTLYPNEPMVDQLMRTAQKAIAKSDASGAS
jgi:hypothetical protein